MLSPIKHDHVTNTGEACVPFQAISVYSLLAQIAVNLYILDENPRVEGSIILTCTQSLYVTFRIIFSVLKQHLFTLFFPPVYHPSATCVNYFLQCLSNNRFFFKLRGYW